MAPPQRMRARAKVRAPGVGGRAWVTEMCAWTFVVRLGPVAVSAIKAIDRGDDHPLGMARGCLQ